MATLKGQKAPRPKTGDGSVVVSRQALEALRRAVEGLVPLPRPTDGEPSAPAKAPAAAEAEAEQVLAYEDDPDLEAVDGRGPVPAEPIAVPVPENNHPLLQTQILEEQPAPGDYEPGTPEFLYWDVAAALVRGIDFWDHLLPADTRWSADQSPLRVELDSKQGTDLNAFYARDSGLNFFHETVADVTVFSGSSPDVSCHELGHAILDALKPELFDAMSTEVAAFHESFGDMSAMLSALQLEGMRKAVLDQTGGELNANSRLSQLARQLGWAIRVKYGSDSADPDCLRNASNQLFYQSPDGLPPSAPANQLASEPHSFSRVFTGAFLDALAAMYQVGPGGDEGKLKEVTEKLGRLLVEGVRLASVGPGYYSQVAAGMIQADQSINGGRYRAALTSSFVQRGILSPSTAVALARDLQAPGPAFGVTGLRAGSQSLQFEGDTEGYKRSGKDAPALPLRPLTTRFGTTFYVHLPAEPNRFAVASAALAGGTEKTFSAEEEARSFVEDLIQLDRIAHANLSEAIPAELIAPRQASPCDRTHHLVKENGKTVLKRHHFDCGFSGCRYRR